MLNNFKDYYSVEPTNPRDSPNSVGPRGHESLTPSRGGGNPQTSSWVLHLHQQSWLAVPFLHTQRVCLQPRSPPKVADTWEARTQLHKVLCPHAPSHTCTHVCNHTPMHLGVSCMFSCIIARVQVPTCALWNTHICNCDLKQIAAPLWASLFLFVEQR